MARRLTTPPIWAKRSRPLCREPRLGGTDGPSSHCWCRWDATTLAEKCRETARMASGGNERSRLAMAQRWDLIADRNNVDAKGALKKTRTKSLRLARKSNQVRALLGRPAPPQRRSADKSRRAPYRACSTDSIPRACIGIGAATATRGSLLRPCTH